MIAIIWLHIRRLVVYVSHFLEKQYNRFWLYVCHCCLWYLYVHVSLSYMYGYLLQLFWFCILICQLCCLKIGLSIWIDSMLTACVLITNWTVLKTKKTPRSKSISVYWMGRLQIFYVLTIHNVCIQNQDLVPAKTYVKD